MRTAAVAALLAGLAWPAASLAARRDACSIVTRAEAQAVLGHRVVAASGQTVLGSRRMVRSCSYSEEFRIDDPASNGNVTVQTMRVGLASFLLTARAEPKVRRIRGLGVPAFVFGAERALFAWRHGTEVLLRVSGVSDPVGKEKQLARKALGRV